MLDPLFGVLLSPLLRTVISLGSKKILLPWGMSKHLKKLGEKLQMIQAILSDAHVQQPTSQAVQLWVKKLKYVCNDVAIVLDEIGYEVLRQEIENRARDKVYNFFSSSNALAFRFRVVYKMKGVMSLLEEVYDELNKLARLPIERINSSLDYRGRGLTIPFMEDSVIVGREDDISDVINMLIWADYERDLPVITIQGMGGQGKTALAQLVYKNDKVRSHFDEIIWILVSVDFNFKTLLAKMLQFVESFNNQLTNTEVLVTKLRKRLGGKRYLLVLDDVWNESREDWDYMRRCLLEIGGSKGSRVLTTTRSEQVALAMQTSKYHRLQRLSDDQSWELFERRAFAEGGPNKSPVLVDIGKRILKRCGGLPLAISVLGDSLNCMNSESDWSVIERSDLWSDSIGGNRVYSVIKQSYDHLPSLSVKQCFACCAIFPKDTVLEKDRLIQFWIAQGLISPPNGSNLQMEEIGNEYFNILLRSSLLQNAGKDVYNNIARYKMHDVVHDVSLQMSENYCFHLGDWKGQRNEIESLHLSILAGERGMWNSLKDIVPSKLRTVHLRGLDVLDNDLSENFQCLYALIVEDIHAKELPNWIGKLKHLRLLDISYCRFITRLPKSITKLYYLQTLRVFQLDEVPVGFEKVINLRHFHVECPCFPRPKGLFARLGQLTNLQTLPFFTVDKCKGCQIEELEHLNLKGELNIFCLQNVTTSESTLKSNLSMKSELQSLLLHWDWREEDCDDTDVMEGLKPHSNLRSLKIYGYQSLRFPSWMIGNNDLITLRCLVNLTLNDLKRCEGLPSLGDLPCLEHLELLSLGNVKCIRREFYGWSNLDLVKQGSCSDKPEKIILFPALKSFKLSSIPNLVGWSDAITPGDPSVEVFPVLEEMEICALSNLKTLPNLGCLPRLQRLRISLCQRLTLTSNWNNIEAPQNSEIRNERAALAHPCVGSEGPSSSCPDDELVNVPDICYLQSLRELSINHCGECFSVSPKILAQLESLEIGCNPSLWPEHLHRLVSLRSLGLGGSTYDRYEEVDCFPFPYSMLSHNIPANLVEDIQYFPSLTHLTLTGSGLPNVTSLSHQIQYLTSLKRLTISSFDCLEALPEWLGNLKSLESLKVSFCPNLKELPSVEAFECLTNLQHLVIAECPILKDRCTKGSGAEWSKISRIPSFNVVDGLDKRRQLIHSRNGILPPWNSYCPDTRLRGKVKRKRPLDWHTIWCHSTEFLAFHHNYRHKLGKTGDKGKRAVVPGAKLS